MRKHLYLVYKNGYIEDYVVLYCLTKDVPSSYCREAEIENIESEEEFYNNYTVDRIDCIDSKRIKDIIFE